jgi:hypothetical protein
LQLHLVSESQPSKSSFEYHLLQAIITQHDEYAVEYLNPLVTTYSVNAIRATIFCVDWKVSRSSLISSRIGLADVLLHPADQESCRSNQETVDSLAWALQRLLEYSQCRH